MATIIIPNVPLEEGARSRTDSRTWHTCVDEDHTPCAACLSQVEKQLIETGKAECCGVVTRTEREFVQHLVSAHHMEEKGAWEMVFPHARSVSAEH